MEHLMRFTLAASFLALAAACSPSAPAAQQPSSAAPQAAAPRPPVALQTTTIAQGLGFPWGIAFLPDGSMLVTEREGRLRIIRNGQLVAEPVAGLPPILVEGQGGLMDVSLHPNFAQNRLVYLTLATGTVRDNHTRLIRARFDGRALTNVQTLYDALPGKEAGFHFGGRILWLPDGTLLLTLGDGGMHRDKAQTLDNAFGKIVRLNADGTIPQDNPFVGRAGAQPAIWSYGHRNVQGIALDPVTGRVFANEHGPRGGDEVNLVERGKNYGWPVITYGVEYSGAIITTETERPGMEQPKVRWTPSIAPSSMDHYGGEAIPQWTGDLFVSALAGMKIVRLDLQNGEIVGQEDLFADLKERFRDVREGPDGSLYLLTDSIDGKVIRVSPR
jgi:aldose sugar dehydrogenase